MILWNTFCLLCNPPFSFPHRPPAQRPAVPRHSSKSNPVTCDADADADATPRNANANDNDNANADADADADADATARHAMPRHAMPCHARHARPTRRDATPRDATPRRTVLAWSFAPCRRSCWADEHPRRARFSDGFPSGIIR